MFLLQMYYRSLSKHTILGKKKQLCEEQSCFDVML